MVSDSIGFRQQIRSLGLRQRLLKVLSFLGLKTYRSSKSLGLSDRLHAYAQSVSLREPDILAQLRQETAQLPAGMMQVAPEEGQLLALLIQLMGAKKTLEIGVFTGYSTLAVALALPADGKTVACDISEEFTAIARRYWQKAGVDRKIDLHIAPALDVLDRLLAEGHANTFDFAFIDADKENYDAYYERSLQLVRPGGLIAIDNVLWSGNVAKPKKQDASTVAIRALNKKVHRDPRVTISLLPVSDGLTLALKRL
ncbi:methyltransferase domain-containing protein [Phormidesmis priestleyi ULC007]|uniref:Methyltransferase domain-containing protein n=1 Tax=Phormidesmis priestleyi ULC007 TaxID=1920490 RepID=A0A2T1DL48_9CYAN|nr:class I SAM-dependent methyltransferase [Phormidesmis priestleyi]PSB21227.1 methyltransferase domain-containing protein [Phormidesmis priestleyi ULC007]PZO51245.1 MAG: methyltransferase domain-containing protein [Phormidesmis priestleyi]